MCVFCFFFQAEDGIRDLVRSRGLGDVYKRQQQLLSSQDFSQILAYVEGYELLAIDEAQGIPNVGMALKIIVDQVPGIRVLATGSSSFELAGQVGEPLTGRKRTLVLYPVSQGELRPQHNRFQLRLSLIHI